MADEGSVREPVRLDARLMAVSLVQINDALGYIRGEFEDGRGLAQLVRGLDLDAGQVEAYVPDDDPGLATRFATGSLPGAREREAVGALVEHLCGARGLMRDPLKALICQFADGATTRPREADLTQAVSRYPTLWLEGAERPYQNGELWFAESNTDAADVAMMLNEALWFPAVAVLTSLPSGTGLEHDARLDYPVLHDLVSRAELVMCGAWDATNYLLWTPSAVRLQR